MENMKIIFPSKVSDVPLEKALTIFTDGSSNGNSVVYTPNQPPTIKRSPGLSAQQAEIIAVIAAVQQCSQWINLYSDSKYVVSLSPALKTVLISGQSKIISLLQKLQQLIPKRTEKIFTGHIRGHSNLPGPLSRGNMMTDLLTKDNLINNVLKQARQSHKIHHQNAFALK